MEAMYFFKYCPLNQTCISYVENTSSDCNFHLESASLPRVDSNVSTIFIKEPTATDLSAYVQWLTSATSCGSSWSGHCGRFTTRSSWVAFTGKNRLGIAHIHGFVSLQENAVPSDCRGPRRCSQHCALHCPHKEVAITASTTMSYERIKLDQLQVVKRSLPGMDYYVRPWSAKS